MQSRTTRWLLGLVLTVPLFWFGTQDAHAQKKAKQKSRPGPDAVVQAGIGFSLQERERITAFFVQEGPEGVKPLPPGIRRNLARGKPLPPGIAKKALAPELVTMLPHRPGYEIVQVGWDVVLVEVATGLIRDVLRDAVR